MKDVREMVISVYKGWERRKRRRLEEGNEVYRSAAISLAKRTRTKLTGKEDWYRVKPATDTEDDARTNRRVTKKRKRGENMKQDVASNNISVMFVQMCLYSDVQKVRFGA